VSSATRWPWPQPDDPLPELTFGPGHQRGQGGTTARTTRRGLARWARIPLHLGSLGDGGCSMTRTPAPIALRLASSHRPPLGRCTTPSRSDRSTRWSSSILEAGARQRHDVSNGAGPHHLDGRPGLRRATGVPRSKRSSRRQHIGAAAGTARRSSAGWASPDGAFVGGELLVQAPTYGPEGADEDLYGNYRPRLVLPVSLVDSAFIPSGASPDLQTTTFPTHQGSGTNRPRAVTTS